MQTVPTDLATAISDLVRLATVVGWAIVAYFFRDVYREFKELRNGVYGPKGLNERLSRLEGQNGHDTH